MALFYIKKKFFASNLLTKSICADKVNCETEMKIMFETINQYSGDYADPPQKIREAGRGIVIENNRILLTYETNTDVYMTPGGGLEEGETLAECCVRELKEEAGILVKPIEQFLRINEYCPECMYVSNYFICEKIGECSQSLTEIEVEHGAVPRWVPIEKAFEIFGEYPSKRRDIASIYMRELTMLNKYLEMQK